MRSSALICALALALSSCLMAPSKALTPGKVVAAYWSSWSIYRAPGGNFQVSNIDTNITTHLVYAFAKLDQSTNTIQSADPWCDLPDNYGLGNYLKFTALKQKRPGLKTTLAIGGWNEGSAKYSAMAASASSRATFAQSVAAFLKKYNFDGIDLDWEYPTQRGGAPADKQNFISLIKDLRAALPAGSLITAAIGAGPSVLQAAYDIPSLNLLDYIHVMAYDYHGNWDTVTGSNAPLKSSDTLNIDWTINYLISNGANPAKIVLGAPFYGRSFVLSSGTGAKLGEPIVQNAGMAGPYTQQSGFLGYNEIAALTGWNKYRDTLSSTPFMSQASNVISYDDPTSLIQKVNYAKSKNLGGMMVWSIETDQFAGGAYPLLRAIYNNL